MLLRASLVSNVRHASKRSLGPHTTVRLIAWRKPRAVPNANGQAPGQQGQSNAQEQAKDKRKERLSKPTPTGRPRDEDIKFFVVRLVDPVTQELGPPLPLSQVIAYAKNLSAASPAENASEAADEVGADGRPAKKNKYGKKYAVELLASEPDPVVRLVDLQEEYKRLKEEHKKKRAEPKGVEEKEIQMTWSVAAGDLEHKLRKVREGLDEGARVAVVFTRKKGQPMPKREEMQMKMQETVDKLAHLAVEYKQREYKNSTTALIYLKPR